MIAAIHIGGVRKRWRSLGAATCVCVLLAGTATGQVLPRHYDPNERQSVKPAQTLPALRLLTTADYPPFNYRDDSGALVGYNIDLAEAICSELQTVCTLQAWPWEQVAEALADNQGDALIGGLVLDAQTGARFEFTSVYLRFPGRFVLPDATTDGSNFAPEHLAGKTIAVRTGSRHADFLARYLPEAKQIEAGTEFDALDLLKTGEADGFFGDGLRAAFWLGENPDCCGFTGDAYFRPDFFGEGLAIAVAQDRDDVTSALDSALARLARSGKMDELYLRWFPIGFY